MKRHAYLGEEVEKFRQAPAMERTTQEEQERMKLLRTRMSLRELRSAINTCNKIFPQDRPNYLSSGIKRFPLDLKNIL